MNTENLCLFYVSKAHLLVILTEYLKDKEDYEVITFLEDGMYDEIENQESVPEIMQTADKINFNETKDFNSKELSKETNKVILIDGSYEYREKASKYINDKMHDLEIKGYEIKIINIYDFEENKFKMSQIFTNNEKILYTVGEEIIEH